MHYQIFEKGGLKRVVSEDGSYNSIFNKITGRFARWGSTPEEDPISGPPEILDLEISQGPCIECEFCYKSNGPEMLEHHMSLDTFKELATKLPRTITQIAFGITNLNANPDFRAIAEYSRSLGIIPNYTFNGHQMDDEWAQWTARTCGAVAVSVYDKNRSYDAIKKLTDAGMSQVNIHFLIAQETYEDALRLLQDRLHDPRLKKLNAIVFLAYKPKGRSRDRDRFHTITDVAKYQKIISFCREHNISFGCDSCSAPLVLKAYELLDPEEYKRVHSKIEPCEASAFSSYINCHGVYFPCSFTEGEGEWETGLDVLTCNDFMKDIWNNPKTQLFRGELMAPPVGCVGCVSQSICRVCPTFPGIQCKVEV